MTAPTEPVPVDGGRTPLEQLITTGQALIDEARAAIAEHQAPMVFTTLEHAVVDGPAYITVAEWEAAIRAAENHELSLRGGRHDFTDLECSLCGPIEAKGTAHALIRFGARHTVEVALKAAHVEVRHG